MNTALPFTNWSLKKALQSERDSFARARIRILFTIAVFALLKSAIVLGFGLAAGQHLQVVRAAISFTIILVLLKMLLYRPSLLQVLTHAMILITVAIIWSNIFLYTHKINLITMQFVFMVMLSSFYVLRSNFGIFYSSLSIIPVLIFLALHGRAEGMMSSPGQELMSPGYEIIEVLNFVTIILSHYLFFGALHVHIREAEVLNQKLELAIAEANKLAESKTNFLSTMSHELRTPLNSVIGIAGLMLNDAPDERQKENLKLLHFSAIDLLGLINNVLDFNKMDSGHQLLQEVQFELAEFVQDLCSVLRVKATSKGLALNVVVDERLRGTNVLSDPTRLSQVLNNLVGNAIKFTDAGSVTLALRLDEETDGIVLVYFSISDTGVGIDPANHKSVFEMFTQVESQDMYKYGGTGLGLAIVKKVLAGFDTDISLSSEPGKGAKFSFPIRFRTVRVIQSKSGAPVEVKQPFQNLKILIAEDNDITRLVLRKQLEKMKVFPTIVENGRKAYEACATNRYDAIFLDLQMPEMDGYEALRQIRALPDPERANIYAVAFTASVTEQRRIEESGFNTYLHKPFNLNELEERLQGIARHMCITTHS